MGLLLPLQNKWKHNSGKKIYHEIQETQFLTVLSAVNPSICTQSIPDFPQKMLWH